MKHSSLKSILTFIFSLVALCSVAQQPSGTLPVLYINTEGRQEVTSKDYYLTADCWLDPKNSGYDAIGSQTAPVLLQIKGRGNYTWSGFDKKPYRLKFDKKQPLCGMKKSKHFVLLAHADDELGFLRNTAGFELSRRLGLPWTPGQIPVELVVNGSYRGLYFVAEKIRVDEDRVNIVEQPDLATDPGEITGGYLVEIDNYDVDPHVTVNDPNRYSGHSEIWFTYHTPEVLSPQQESYLLNQLQTINDLIGVSSRTDTQWEKYVDIDMLARYYIVQEILDDAESFHGSCYLYKEKGEGQKWMFGPVWDFGNAFRRGDSKRFIYDLPPYGQAWIGRFARFDNFQAKVKEIWKEFVDNHYEDLADYLRNFISQISAAAKNDAQRWPNYGNADLTSDYNNFMWMLESRIDWLGRQWGKAPVDPDPNPGIPAQVYLRGDFNRWSSNTPFSRDEEDGLYYIRNISIGSSEFKIADEDWSLVNLGSNGEPLMIGEPYQLESPGANITATQEIQECDFILDLDNQTLLVVKHEVQQPQPGKGETIFLRGTFNNWDVTHQFKYNEADGLYYIIDITTGDSSFKVADADWGDLNFGSNGSELRVGAKYGLQAFTNENIKPHDYIEHCDFIVNLSEPSLIVVETGTMNVVASTVKDEISIVGSDIYAEGPIKVYDLQGRLVSQGIDHVTTDCSGMLIVVTSEGARKHLFR